MQPITEIELAELLDQHIRTYRKDIAPKSLKKMRLAISHYIEFLNGNQPTNDNFDLFIQSMIDARVSPCGIRHKKAFIISFHKKYESRIGLVRCRVRLPPIAYPREVYTEAEARDIMSKLSHQEKGAFLLGLRAGLRISDIALIDWYNIDMGRGWITFTPKKTVKARAEAKVSFDLTGDLGLWLAEHRKMTGGAGRLLPTVDTDKMRTALRRAGTNKTFHTTRRTFLTNLMSSGVSHLVAMKCAGIGHLHTLQHYYVPNDDALVNARKTMDEYIARKQ